jgi:hypothetical protein
VSRETNFFTVGNELPEFYVDSARMAANFFTIILEFGVQSMAEQPGSPPPVTPLLTLRMSPQHAVALSNLLQKNLANFEQMLGQPIPVAPELPEGG